MSRSALHSPFPTGASWLPRALVASACVHVLAVIATLHWMTPTDEHETELVDIEMAPAPPKAEALPAEVEKPPEQMPTAHDEQTPAATEPSPPAEAIADAGIDAPVDAARRRDAAIDAPIDAPIDAVPMVAEAPGDALADGGGGDATEVALAGSGSGSGLGSAAGLGSGVPAAIAQGSGSGEPGMDTQPAVDGAPTTAGTAANLLAYFPPGHVVSVLVRFDRMRGTEWAAASERLFRPMPDYRGLFGDRDAGIAQKLDMLVISTPRPRDATATTLVMHTTQSRAQIRDLLATNPIAWTAAKGGMLGKRGKLYPGDVRVVLSPWQGWYVLAPPADLPGMTAAATGNIEALETKAKLPPWLATIRTIDKEAGGADKRGPALVMTVGEPPHGTQPAASGRYKLPDVGLGVTSLPVPQRISLAMELVKQGWLVRGNIVFASEADAAEIVQTLQDAQAKVTGSHILSALLQRQHVLNVVAGLSLQRTGARVSYATSLSIADARAVLAAAAVTLGEYFQGAP